MIYRKIGKTDLTVSAIALGGNIFGYTCDKNETHKLINQAKEYGINFIDTADVYSQGASEKYIGNAIRVHRKDWIIATKIGLESHSIPKGLGRKNNIINKVELSLKRLKTDYIDLYQIHHWDSTTSIHETIEAFEILIQQGKIRYAGCSNYSADQLNNSIAEASKYNLIGYSCIQLHYNLLKRDSENHILPLCRKNNIGALVYGALGRGVLTDKYISNNSSLKRNNRAEKSLSIRNDLTPFMLQKTTELHNYLNKRNTSLGDIALLWALKNKSVSSLILGIRDETQLKKNISAIINSNNINIDWQKLDFIIGNTDQYKKVSLGCPNISK